MADRETEMTYGIRHFAIIASCRRKRHVSGLRVWNWHTRGPELVHKTVINSFDHWLPAVLRNVRCCCWSNRSLQHHPSCHIQLDCESSHPRVQHETILTRHLSTCSHLNRLHRSSIVPANVRSVGLRTECILFLNRTYVVRTCVLYFKVRYFV